MPPFRQESAAEFHFTVSVPDIRTLVLYPIALSAAQDGSFM